LNIFANPKTERLKVFHSIEEFQKVKGSVVTTGTFDGVHVGHRKLINRLNETGQKDRWRERTSYVSSAPAHGAFSGQSWVGAHHNHG